MTLDYFLDKILYIFIYEPMYYMGFFMSINKKIIKLHHD
jgi:hypothetical protein